MKIGNSMPLRKSAMISGDNHRDWPIVDRFQKGDRKAGNEMLQRHEGMLRRIAGNYPTHLGKDDLLQEARMGFLDGLGRARRGHGTAPASYAFWWARSYITKFMLDSGLVRVPASAQRGRLKYPEKVMIKTHFVDIDAEDAVELPDWRCQIDSDEATSKAIDQSNAILFRCYFPRLTSTERAVLRKRYLSGDEVVGLREVGQHIGCSGEYVRQIQNRAIQKLSKLCEADLLLIDGFMDRDDKPRG